MDIDKLFSEGGIDGIADNVFGVVNNSVSEVKDMQRKKVAENVQLVVEALKKIESDIRERFDSVGNAIEKRVITIKDGRDGANGSDGKPGKDGKAGRDGAPGVKGTDGRNGNDGADGVDGVSVTNAHIDFDGSLVISLSSGVVMNVGEVVAPELAEQIKIVSNGGGTSQYVLDTLASLQAQITALIPSQTGNSGKFLTTDGTATSWATVAGSGTVTSVAQSFTGGLISVAGSPITSSGTLALTVAGTSGGVPYFSSASTWATSAALTASALVIGGGAGSAPATTTTGTGVVTALGVNTGTAGAFVVNGGALGTPASGTVTNLTGTASININGTVGATTPSTGAFTSTKIGTANAVSNLNTIVPNLTVNGTGVSQGIQVVRNTTPGGGGAFIIASATRGSDVNSYTVLQNNDGFGTVSFMGTDGTAFVPGASIAAQVDGTPGANDMPGRLMFLTTADGASVSTERMRIDSSGNVLVTNVAGLGYGTGAGGTVTQATSKSTGVTLNKPTGQITMNAAALASATIVSFVLTNTVVAVTDLILINHVSGGTGGAYTINGGCAAGGVSINVRNNTAGSLSEALVLSFAIIKGVTA